MTDRNSLVVDLSHWNTVNDWDAMANAGVLGVIHKFSQGADYTDPTCAARAPAAKASGLLWGRYHFGDGSNVTAQVNEFLSDWTDDELLALDWEDNAASQMTLDQAVQFVREVEARTGVIPVLYTGNTCKEALDRPNAALSRCRLWLAHYASEPVCPPGWSAPWLWQWTSSGRCAGVAGDVDCDSYEGTRQQLIAEWVGGEPAPAPAPDPGTDTVSITMTVPASAKIVILTTGNPADIVINPTG